MFPSVNPVLFGESQGSKNNQRRNNSLILGGNVFAVTVNANRIIRATTGISQKAGEKRKICSGNVRMFKTMYIKTLQAAEQYKIFKPLTYIARKRSLRIGWNYFATGSAIVAAVGSVFAMLVNGPKIFDKAGSLPLFNKTA